MQRERFRLRMALDYAAKLGLPQSVIDVAKLFREKHSTSAFSHMK